MNLLQALYQRALQEQQAMKETRIGVGPDPNSGKRLSDIPVVGGIPGVAGALRPSLAGLHALGLLMEGSGSAAKAATGGGAAALGGYLGAVADIQHKLDPAMPGREATPQALQQAGTGFQQTNGDPLMRALAANEAGARGNERAFGLANLALDPLNYATPAAKAPGLLGAAGRLGSMVNDVSVAAPLLPFVFRKNLAQQAAREAKQAGLVKLLGMAPETAENAGPLLPPVLGPARPGRIGVPETQLPETPYRPGNARVPLGPGLPPELGPLLPPEYGPALPTKGNTPLDQLIARIGRNGGKGIGPLLPPELGPAVPPSTPVTPPALPNVLQREPTFAYGPATTLQEAAQRLGISQRPSQAPNTPLELLMAAQGTVKPPTPLRTPPTPTGPLSVPVGTLDDFNALIAGPWASSRYLPPAEAFAKRLNVPIEQAQQWLDDLVSSGAVGRLPDGELAFKPASRGIANATPNAAPLATRDLSGLDLTAPANAITPAQERLARLANEGVDQPARALGTAPDFPAYTDRASGIAALTPDEIDTLVNVAYPTSDAQGNAIAKYGNPADLASRAVERIQTQPGLAERLSGIDDKLARKIALLPEPAGAALPELANVDIPAVPTIERMPTPVEQPSAAELLRRYREQYPQPFTPEVKPTQLPERTAAEIVARATADVPLQRAGVLERGTGRTEQLWSKDAHEKAIALWRAGVNASGDEIGPLAQVPFAEMTPEQAQQFFPGNIARNPAAVKRAQAEVVRRLQSAYPARPNPTVDIGASPLVPSPLARLTETPLEAAQRASIETARKAAFAARLEAAKAGVPLDQLPSIDAKPNAPTGMLPGTPKLQAGGATFTPIADTPLTARAQEAAPFSLQMQYGGLKPAEVGRIKQVDAGQTSLLDAAAQTVKKEAYPYERRVPGINATFRTKLPPTAKLPGYNMGDEASVIYAAQRYHADRPLYVVPTQRGLTLDVSPPFGRETVAVLPDGTVQRTPYAPPALDALPADGSAALRTEFKQGLQDAFNRGNADEIGAMLDMATEYKYTPAEANRLYDEMANGGEALSSIPQAKELIESSPYFAVFKYFDPKTGELYMRHATDRTPLMVKVGDKTMPLTNRLLRSGNYSEIWELPGSGYDEVAASAQGKVGGYNPRNATDAGDFWRNAREAFRQYRQLSAGKGIPLREVRADIAQGGGGGGGMGLLPGSPDYGPDRVVMRGLGRATQGVRDGIPLPNQRAGVVFGTTDPALANKYAQQYSSGQNKVLAYRIKQQARIANVTDPAIAKQLADELPNVDYARWGYLDDPVTQRDFIKEISNGPTNGTNYDAEFELLDEPSVIEALANLGYDGATDGVTVGTWNPDMLARFAPDHPGLFDSAAEAIAARRPTGQTRGALLLTAIPGGLTGPIGRAVLPAAGAGAGAGIGYLTGDNPEDARANALKGAAIGGALGAGVEWSPELARQVANLSQGTMYSPTMLKRMWDAGIAAQTEAANSKGVVGAGNLVKAAPGAWRAQAVNTIKQFPQDALTRLVTLWGIARKELGVTGDDIRYWQEVVADELATGVSNLNNPVTDKLRRVGMQRLLDPAEFTKVYGTDFVTSEATRAGTKLSARQSAGMGAAFAVANGLRTLNPLSAALGAVKGRFQPFINGFVQFGNGVQHDAFRYAMAEKTLARDIPQLAKALTDDLAARGVDVSSLLAKGGYFSGADVASVAGAKLGQQWDTLVEETIRNGGDRIAFLAGDFREASKYKFEDSAGKVFPFIRWPLHYGPVLAEVAANNPRLAAVAAGLLAAQQEAAKQGGLKVYERLSTPITTETPVLGALARARLGGQAGTVRLNLPGSVLPYTQLLGGVEMPQGDNATGYEKAKAALGAAGMSPNPLIQAGAYVLGQDYQSPGALSRTAGLEALPRLLPGAAGRLEMPGVGTLLDTTRKLLAPATGAHTSEYDPTYRRYAELVLQTTKKPLDDVANQHYLLQDTEAAQALYTQAKREVVLAGAAGNVYSLTSPISATARGAGAQAAQTAKAGLPFDKTRIDASTIGTLQELMRAANDRYSQANPAVNTYAVSNPTDAKYTILRQWEASPNAVWLKFNAPSAYTRAKKSLAELLGLTAP